MRQMIDEEAVIAHRERGLTSDRPVLRGTAQNPDTYFQGARRSTLLCRNSRDHPEGNG